ncbi:GMC oxidoreductase [Nocardioides koreensis]|uniref:Cholesterol oxidase n=1 Tax=Nocardioides koreensis TaxID=433651 RepID=A0ABN2ZT66_9ACTN
MGALSRRTFLGAAAGVTAVGVAGPARASILGVPVTEERRQAVVIGSGFGGGVTARRLGQAGIRTLVLERGRRWPTGPGSDTFPTLMHNDKRSSWLSPVPTMPAPYADPTSYVPYTGLIERHRGQGIDIMCAAAVGGGSVPYHGMTVQPQRESFETTISRSIDYDQLDADHYRRVARDLRVSPIPDDVLADPHYSAPRMFQRRGQEAGFDTFRIDTPTDWDVVRRELRGELPPSYITGDIIFGCNNGGRWSVDVTYLAQATATGNVEVAPLHRVADISRSAAGEWVVRAERIDTAGNVLQRKAITTPALFLGAGSPGTTRLMVKARDKGLIPDLPDGVGTGWGTNGERVYVAATAEDSPGEYQAGPVSMGARDWSDPARALTMTMGPMPTPVDPHAYSVAGFMVTTQTGEWQYDALRDDAVPVWDRTKESDTKPVLDAAVERLTSDTPYHVNLDSNLLDDSTWHSVGGMPFGTAVDDAGRVLGQRGLYVMDGSRIAGSCAACNPSMTIAALAEYSMDRVLREDMDVLA